VVPDIPYAARDTLRPDGKILANHSFSMLPSGASKYFGLDRRKSPHPQSGLCRKGIGKLDGGALDLCELLAFLQTSGGAYCLARYASPLPSIA
jgi:hypothetical protein